jgi:hypothetical protein
MQENRRIRVFVSSTFRDMAEERNELMTHTWAALRRLCRERYIPSRSDAHQPQADGGLKENSASTGANL